jgi:hypothetical protein
MERKLHGLDLVVESTITGKVYRRDALEAAANCANISFPSYTDRWANNANTFLNDIWQFPLISIFGLNIRENAVVEDAREWQERAQRIEHLQHNPDAQAMEDKFVLRLIPSEAPGFSIKVDTRVRMIHCPNPDHEDIHPSCRFDELTGEFFCFTCKARGTFPIDDVQAHRNSAAAQLPEGSRLFEPSGVPAPKALVDTILRRIHNDPDFLVRLDACLKHMKAEETAPEADGWGHGQDIGSDNEALMREFYAAEAGTDRHEQLFKQFLGDDGRALLFQKLFADVSATQKHVRNLDPMVALLISTLKHVIFPHMQALAIRAGYSMPIHVPDAYQGGKLSVDEDFAETEEPPTPPRITRNQRAAYNTDFNFSELREELVPANPPYYKYVWNATKAMMDLGFDTRLATWSHIPDRVVSPHEAWFISDKHLTHKVVVTW